MDPTALVKAGIKVGSLASKFLGFASSDPKAIARAINENYQDFVIETAQHVGYVEARLFEQGMKIEEIEARLARATEDREEQRLFYAFAFEAMREALADRRAMLAAAAAGLALLDLPVEDKARCERTLRQLDPRHVLQLHGLSRVAGNVFRGVFLNDVGNVRHGVWLTLEDGEVLVSAGCVRLSDVNVWGASGTGGVIDPASADLTITRTGKLVLTALDAYTRARPIPFAFEVPGREVWAGSRTEDDARRVLAEQAPGLADMVAPLARAKGARYSFPSWSTPAGALEPPPFDGAAWLQIEGVDRESAERVRAVRPFEPVRHENMRATGRMSEVAVDAHKFDGRDDWYVRVYGPHDVLRWLAEDVDAAWY